MAKELIADALLKEEIAIDISHLDLNTEDANAYFRELLANDKRLFHVLKGWMYPKVDDDKVLTTIYPNYDRHLVDNYDYYYNLLDTEIDKVVALASEGKTDLEKILIINDYLATNFEYDTLGLKSDTEIRDKVRFIEERRGVCESYADFAKLVLNELGIPNITVSSIRLNHIWNMVENEGHWYNVDFTWSDVTPNLTGRASHENFMVSNDRKIELNKKLDDWTNTVPYIADSLKYEEMFRATTAPFAVVDDALYYINNVTTDDGSATGNIYSLDVKTGESTLIYEALADTKWYTSASTYYAGKYTGFGEIGGMLYYNTPTTVMLYDVTTDKATPLNIDMTEELWGLKVSDTQLTLVSGDDIKKLSDFEHNLVSVAANDALEQLIDTSRANLDTVIVDPTGDDINPYNQWVTATEYEAFADAISAASEGAATDEAQDALLAAYSEFNFAKESGKIKADKTLLARIVAIAENNLATTATSPADLNEDKIFWISPTYYTYLEDKLIESRLLLDDKKASQDKVNKMVFYLHNRNQLFVSTRKN